MSCTQQPFPFLRLCMKKMLTNKLMRGVDHRVRAWDYRMGMKRQQVNK